MLEVLTAFLPPVIEEICHHCEDSLTQCEGKVNKVSYEVFIRDPGQEWKLLSRSHDLY